MVRIFFIDLIIIIKSEMSIIRLFLGLCRTTMVYDLLCSLENVVCKMLIILFPSQCVNWHRQSRWLSGEWVTPIDYLYIFTGKK